MFMKTIVIVGAGASGLVASIYAKSENTRVILLERNLICGKKILVTGNGRCNYWNIDQDLRHYNSDNRELLSEIITTKNKNEVMQLFASIGISPRIKNNYCYPMSNQATSIKDALVVEAKRRGVEIEVNTLVENVKYVNGKYKIFTSNGNFVADSLIISAGSMAYPKTGSDGSGYALLKSLGHSLIEPREALVALKGEGKYFKDWAGIRSDVKLTLMVDREVIKEECGEIQLTDYGISGICTFNISRYIPKLLSVKKKPVVIINFLPFITNCDIAWLEERNKVVKGRTIKELLDGLLNSKLVLVILKLCNIEPTSYLDDLPYPKKEVLLSNLTNFSLPITGTLSFDACQVCSGGIPLTEISCDTMESLISRDLYITGECLDVDGECGGYNLSFAWISGMLAGKSSARK